MFSKVMEKEVTYTGCYSGEAYDCDGTPVTDDALKGVAFIMRVSDTTTGLGDSGEDENIVWQKFFEAYNSVTALKLSRQETIPTAPTWSGSAWSHEPSPTSIYTNFVAAFLQSRCQTLRPQKIVIMDYSDGSVL
mmetsp:Transcript_14973/g.23172  ORF Transcript_14973/g.23172 Transcript_14973/m.23172 type:complete len:134 (+) Transcript_14973:365-766(+)